MPSFSWNMIVLGPFVRKCGNPAFSGSDLIEDIYFNALPTEGRVQTLQMSSVVYTTYIVNKFEVSTTFGMLH